jgi:uncharacterized protein (DUF885 family)
MLKPSLLMLCLTVALTGCSSSERASSAASETNHNNHSANDKVNHIVDNYFLHRMKTNPITATFNGYSQFNHQFRAPINAENRAKTLAQEQAYLQKIEQLDPSDLSGQALLSYEVFKLDRQLAIDGSRFPSYMVPINQMSGFHNIFAGIGSGKSAQPFKTIKDYEKFMARADGFVLWMDSAIVAMRQGIDANVTLPKVLVNKLLPQLKSQVKADIRQSIFWLPIKNMPAVIAGSPREQLTRDYHRMIKYKLIPAYARMTDFIEQQYLPAARQSIGYSQLPDGESWYQHQIKVNTTLDLTAKQIHQIGLEEVDRILGEMNKVKQQVNFNGDMAEFFEHLKTDDQFYFESEQALIDGYNNIKDKIESRVPQLFDIQPKAPYVVRAVEKYRAQSAAGASYQSPAPDGSRPGIFYINTHNLKAQPKFIMETLSIHEAAPGHHFQLALQQEIEGLPDYRKFGGYTAYAEGWALYAESLGKEMGLFTDPYMWYGRLVDEQLRAMRLVVDTGMHAMGWSREQAIEYMKANSSMAQSDITAEVERYIAWPGQALSYKLGQRKIRELRTLAEQKLGDKFDVRKFHTQILIDGSLPMPTLEKKILSWLNQ